MGNGKRGHEIAVLDELDPGARGTHVVDELFVSRTVEDDDGQVADVAIQRLRDDLKILGDGSVKIDLASRGCTDHELLHVSVGRVQKTTRLRDGHDSTGVGAALCHRVRALERIDRDVYLWAVAAADPLADEKHRRFRRARPRR